MAACPKEIDVPRTALTRESVPLTDLMRQIVSIPSISFREEHVVAALRTFAEERDLRYVEVARGNVLIEYRKDSGRRPLVLGAHMDHPGFVVSKVGASRGGRALQLEFRGGIGAAYGKGERVRIYGADGEDRGTATITLVRQPSPQVARLDRAMARLDADSTVEVGEVAGRKVTFKVTAHDGIDKIGEGRHERMVVPWERVKGALAAKAAKAGLPAP